ncbi:lipid phosphate phosphatase gamma [Arachis duranensis]|uniref:Lipid phosphate phosphatase gamma n=2 Tax=Arachis TaxID=3817 RepID=A0A6P4BI03_ARADU|nr:lipid phosphate phosphatase gamma, chloroplastic [Arachis ipaensis]XP_016184890.1 lipid phosphate phosphatase gamma, chloroplastic [Arachis ipaensis]XP_016184891.1 lipid phosphate phosphatase gamma, chloroplastic [Arachis ipaensis]XP_020972439.1 lipid phosphate phosphatase gamma, chloroplastic [Arachis ipaensis]XP_020972440.1 lipid phosphate phosphatase gamma, chloroplastic [Arachis ipaensis]XP_025635155.1 lipid phosphate phosphatase gamma-like [Arachis hypogaea]XP_025635156.1 lipid phosph
MTNAAAPLKAITLTHVRYQRGDPLGHFLAWVSLVPVFISLAGFLSHFLFRREIHGLTFALGLIISQVVNEFIKTSVQQSRPDTCHLLEVCDSHGWPSSHCQYMFFFATYLTLLSSRGLAFWDRSSNLFVHSLTWGLALLTICSRVYLGYHTLAQTFAGTALGVFLGAAWFWIVTNLLSPYFPLIEESSFGRNFYLKDTSHIRNVLKFEYDTCRAERARITNSDHKSR